MLIANATVTMQPDAHSNVNTRDYVDYVPDPIREAAWARGAFQDAWPMTRKEKVLQVVVVAAGIVIVFLLVAVWLGTQIGD